MRAIRAAVRGGIDEEMARRGRSAIGGRDAACATRRVQRHRCSHRATPAALRTPAMPCVYQESLRFDVARAQLRACHARCVDTAEKIAQMLRTPRMAARKSERRCPRRTYDACTGAARCHEMPPLPAPRDLLRYAKMRSSLLQRCFARAAPI